MTSNIKIKDAKCAAPKLSPFQDFIIYSSRSKLALKTIFATELASTYFTMDFFDKVDLQIWVGNDRFSTGGRLKQKFSESASDHWHTL